MFRTYKEKEFCLILTFNIKTFRLNWLDIWFASPYIVYLLFKIKQNYITLKATSFYWQLPEKQIFSSPDLNSSSQLKHVNIFNLHHFSRFIFTLRNWSEANLPKQLINPAQFVPILTERPRSPSQLHALMSFKVHYVTLTWRDMRLWSWCGVNEA